mgnify:CR=1 FL=1
MRVQLLTGQDALERVNADAFQAQWKGLHARCPWATACQHPDFVLTWYRFYGTRHVPVVVLAQAADGALSGLLTLALRPGARQLCGAGDQQAEYQGWLLPPGADDGFVAAAIGQIRAAFPLADLCLRYLPPGIALGALADPDRFGGVAALRRHRRPLMHIDAAAMARQRNKKNHRQNYNRLGRIGEVKFERVVGHERFAGCFDEVCMQYDFRQAALYRSMPFSSDASKKPFYLALHRNGLLHATVLRVGDAIAAAHLGLLSQGRAVHLGINTHHPALAAHSPGNLLLAMLGVHLADEDIPALDLTPGGDRYKEYFASGHDVVFELTVYRDSGRRWLHEAIFNASRLLKDRLQAAGYRLSDVSAFLQKLKDPATYGMKALCAQWNRRFRSRVVAFEYGGGVPASLGTNMAISKNSVQDIMRYDASGSAIRYRDFLNLAMQRMERSSDVFSLVQNGKLQMCCWAQALVADPGPAYQEQKQGDAIVLSDLHIHRDVQDLEPARDFVLQIVCGLQRGKRGVSVYYRGTVDGRLRRLMSMCGFTEQAP